MQDVHSVFSNQGMLLGKIVGYDHENGCYSIEPLTNMRKIPRNGVFVVDLEHDKVFVFMEDVRIVNIKLESYMENSIMNKPTRLILYSSVAKTIEKQVPKFTLFKDDGIYSREYNYHFLYDKFNEYLKNSIFEG